MKIVQINAVIEKSSIGRTTSELHRALKAAGHESWVAATNAIDSADSIKIGTQLDRKIHSLYSHTWGRQGYASFFSTKKLISRLKEIKPDVVHLRNLHGNYINFPLLLKYLASNKIPVVITLHDCWFFTGHCCYFVDSNCSKWQLGCGHCPDLHRWNVSWFFDHTHKNWEDKRKLFGRLDKLAVIGVSKWVTNFIPDSILKDASIIRPIYNWIDTNLFHPCRDLSLRRKYADDNQKIVLGVSHYWDNYKGLESFIKLAPLLPEYQFVLVGGMPNNIHLPSNMTSVGLTSNATELAHYYSMADIFFNPSTRETFGKVTAEALCCGTPVVAYNATATPELVPDECGKLVEVGDLQKAAECIKSITQKEGIREKCREFACSTFDMSKLIKDYIGVYEELLRE